MQTTIKVPSDLRDRVNFVASEAGLTAAKLIDQLLDERLRREQMVQFGRAFRSADESYWDEFTECDRLN